MNMYVAFAKYNVQLQRIIYTYNVRVKRLVAFVMDRYFTSQARQMQRFFVKLREGNKTAPFTSLGFKASVMQAKR